VAITRRTLKLAGDLRVTINTLADQATRELVAAWARAYDGLADEMAAAVDQLLAVGDGEWPTKGQIARATRAQKALQAARDSLAQLARDATVTITDAAGHAVDLSAEAQPRIIASQLPPSAGPAATLAATFDRVDPGALRAIVKRSTQQIVSSTRPLSAESSDSMKRALVRGVAVGDNPRAAATRMLRGLEQGFNGGLTRALTVARTEILDAHRAGAQAAQVANSDVLNGWVWTAQLDERTCPSCWSKHGELHALDDPGPQDHPQGRCAATPQTKSWRELGFPHLAEPPSVLPDARTVFDAMPASKRLAVMGPARLDALDSGRVGWSQLSTRRAADGWRDSYQATSLTALGLA
jgi:SPP1 gp7 family putative phage head morphogenesis protein